MTHDELDLRLPNDIGQLEALSDELESFVERADIPAAPAYRLQLAIDEFFNNSVDYGYPDGRAGEIHIHVRRTADGVDLTFSDDADPFDPFDAPAPDLTGSLEERRIGGLGVHLVRTLSSHFAYRREHGRNVVTVRFALS